MKRNKVFKKAVSPSATTKHKNEHSSGPVAHVQLPGRIPWNILSPQGPELYMSC